MKNEYLHLKSGTDIRGMVVATEHRTVELTEDISHRVGAAFVRWLQRTYGRREGSRIAVGHDSRVTAEPLRKAVIRGIRSAGAHVIDCGLCTTPAMFLTTKLLNCNASVMITASHMPWYYNGFKFFTPDGGLGGRDVAQILEDAEQHMVKNGDDHAVSVNFLAIYQEFLKNKVRVWLGDQKPLSGLHIVVDAGNGSGGFYAKLLSELGANTEGSLFLVADGHFPNHIPNPESAEAMSALSEAVLLEKADLGVAFDADCDRVALMDDQGRAINRNRLIALTSAMLLMEVKPMTVVTDSVTSAGLSEFIAEQGGAMHRFKRGYRNVIDEAKRLCTAGTDCRLAMETSGHAAFFENYFLDDGMYLATRLIVLAKRMQINGKKLCDLIEGLREPAESDEIRIPIVAGDMNQISESAIKSVEISVLAMPGWSIDRENMEGVRVLCGNGHNWFLLRPSLHDPLLVLNVESSEQGGVLRMLKRIREFLLKHDSLDCRPIDERLGKA